MKHVNKQIQLNCANCGKEFQKCVYEVSRRKAKGPSTNFFCSRTCTGIYSNKVKAVPSIAPKPQYGNTYRRKYNQSYAWYVSRLCKDRRFNIPTQEAKMLIHDELVRIWTGKCAFTGVDIFLKDSKGKCETSDPFHIASVDRIDNDLPYQPGNIQWVSFAMNMSRNKVSRDEFITYLQSFTHLIISTGIPPK